MKVKTLNNKEITELCRLLIEQIKISDFKPDLILGIKTGGENIARCIKDIYSDNSIKLDFCEIVRDSTNKKKNFFKDHLRNLPLPVLNLMRIIEAKFFFNKKSRRGIKGLIFPDNIGSYKKILLVDDAVDSGATINIIKSNLKELDAEIKTAVITVTRKDPVEQPDFTIFNDETLIRFPWSIDSK